MSDLNTELAKLLRLLRFIIVFLFVVGIIMFILTHIGILS